MTDNILAVKAFRRKKRVNLAEKSEPMKQRINDCEGDQKQLFYLIHSLLGSKKITVFPEYINSFTLASTINMFFLLIKVTRLKWNFHSGSVLPVYSFLI